MNTINSINNIFHDYSTAIFSFHCILTSLTALFYVSWFFNLPFASKVKKIIISDNIPSLIIFISLVIYSLNIVFIVPLFLVTNDTILYNFLNTLMLLINFSFISCLYVIRSICKFRKYIIQNSTRS